MSHFIKLKKLLINTKYIHNISISPNKYSIYMIHHSGGSGFIIAGSGFYSTKEYEITVCKKLEPLDYQIVADWIYLDKK